MQSVVCLKLVDRVLLDAGYWMLDTECWMLDAGCWILDAGCWRLVAGMQSFVPIESKCRQIRNIFSNSFKFIVIDSFSEIF